MTAQKPRRVRRRAVPASALPRPSSVEREAQASAEFDDDETVAGRPAALHHRQHHVTKDYSYVHRDLLTILGVGIVVVAFIVAMSFVVA
jgi:hypothetical protein